MSTPDAVSAWVNWNPEPRIHAYGTAKYRSGEVLVLALCRVTVRKKVGTFDPEAADACSECAEFVTAGLTWEDVFDRPTALGSNVIVCRRPSAHTDGSGATDA